jgi:hypothetical protein
MRFNTAGQLGTRPQHFVRASDESCSLPFEFATWDMPQSSMLGNMQAEMY